MGNILIFRHNLSDTCIIGENRTGYPIKDWVYTALVHLVV
jgi:hypothetical protein